MSLRVVMAVGLEEEAREEASMLWILGLRIKPEVFRLAQLAYQIEQQGDADSGEEDLIDLGSGKANRQ